MASAIRTSDTRPQLLRFVLDDITMAGVVELLEHLTERIEQNAHKIDNLGKGVNCPGQESM